MDQPIFSRLANLVKKVSVSIVPMALALCVWPFAETHCSARPEVITDPELDYVNSTHLPGDFEPARNTVYRLDLKLTKNSRPTVFLSFAGMTDRDGRTWTAYSPVKGGYRRIDNTMDGNLIYFRTDFFLAGEHPGLNDGGGILVLYPGKGGGDLGRYRIADGVARYRPIRTLNYGNPKDLNFVRKVFKRDEASITEYFAHPPYQTLYTTAIKARSH